MNNQKLWAVVTGASAGLGKAFAEQLAIDYNLLLVARRKDKLEQLANELGNKTTVKILSADLAKPENLKMIEYELSQIQNINLLVNNAGFGTTGEFAELDIDNESKQINLNIAALTRLTHVAINNMKNIGSGNIINVSSMAALQPTPYSATYSATKAFVKTFSESIQEEVRDYGIKIQCLCPGFTHTEFHEVGNIDISSLPEIIWMHSDEVVRISLDALSHNQVVIVPGLLNKTMAALSSITPNNVTSRLTGLFMRLSSFGNS